MLWFFHRDNTRIDMEVRKNQEGTLYEIVVRYPEGSAEVVQVEDAKELINCVLELQNDLVNDGWTPRVTWDVPQTPAPLNHVDRSAPVPHALVSSDPTLP